MANDTVQRLALCRRGKRGGERGGRGEGEGRERGGRGEGEGRERGGRGEGEGRERGGRGEGEASGARGETICLLYLLYQRRVLSLD